MRNLRRRLFWVPPCLIGAAAFLAVVGPGVLSPTNVGWLRARPDSMTHYLGWVFFRQSPWTVPLGLNPSYGLELGSSIVYSDSIPLLALMFKPMSQCLPEPFQVHGHVAARVLSSSRPCSAGSSSGLATPRTSLRLAGCALFVFAPPMLFRLAGHWALVGHWTILAALALALRPGRRRQVAYWALLGAVAALVHMYLVVMVSGIWLGAWGGDVCCRGRRRRELALEMAVVPIAVLTAMWQAGVFAVAEGKSAGGFGAFRFNLVAPVNAFGWSFVLPDLKWQPGDYEGFAFFGLGALLAGIVALHAAIRLRARGRLTLPREWVPLGLALLGFTVFAASNNVGVGLHDFPYPLPPWIGPVAGLVRASGRLFWPVFYALLLAVVALIVRAYPARVSLGLLTAAVAIQVVDTSAGWRNAYRAAVPPADGDPLAAHERLLVRRPDALPSRQAGPAGQRHGELGRDCRGTPRGRVWPPTQSIRPVSTGTARWRSSPTQWPNWPTAPSIGRVSTSCRAARHAVRLARSIPSATSWRGWMVSGC